MVRGIAIGGAVLLLISVAWLLGPRNGRSPVTSSGNPWPQSSPPVASSMAAAPTVTAEPQRRPVAETAPRAAARVLRGTVLDPGGQPLSGAQVAILILNDDGPEIVGETGSGPDGGFTIEAPALDAGIDLALVARHRGLRPATLLLRSSRRWHDEARVLRLERAETITGRVLANGVGVSAMILTSPGPGCITLGPKRAGDPVLTKPRPFLAEDWPMWADGRLEERPGALMTRPDGSFEITGLGPQPLHLTVQRSSAEGWGVDDALSAHGCTVTPPRKGVVIDITNSEVEVRGWPTALEGIRARLEFGPHEVTKPLEAGSAVFTVPPNEEVTLALSHPHYPTVERTVITPPPGRRTVVDLALGVERASLQLVLHGAAALQVDEVSVRLTSASGEARKTLRTARLPDSDRFLCGIVPLDAGTYDVVVSSSGRGSEPGRNLLPVTGTVELPASGSVTLELDAALGGRIEARIRAPNRADYHARLRVCSAGGEPLLQASELLDTHDRVPIKLLARWQSITPDDGDRTAPSHGLLPAGTYRLRVDADGYQPSERDVPVSAGHTSTVEIVLRPERDGESR